MAVIQILIYAGAILVLFLFMLMLMGVDTESELRKPLSLLKRSFIYTVIAGFILEILLVIRASANLNFKSPFIIGAIEDIGKTLFSQYLLQFELVSLVLLVGVFGVISLTRKET